ncbi:neuronal acetylcholine receptor subunit alpha-10-like isoform X2 [Antedon mediterranea]|uniref:neuronal acetylcholine receptor subunit alpha-10-like isoform X2 n=1 Tax=Antedon mediterranea TaxID=105859 RepID=UPI003AF61FC0
MCIYNTKYPRLPIAAIFVTVMFLEGFVASSEHKRLREVLFTDYDVSVRPVINSSDPTVIDLQFFVAQVLDVDERRETFKINAWLTMRWIDEYLRWDPEDYNGVFNFKTSNEKVWMPDLWLYNNAGSRYEHYYTNSICSIYNTGRVVWQSPAIITTHCTMDVTHFPFDKQTCRVKFGPWQHGANEISLNGTGSHNLYLYNVSSSEWEIFDFDAHNGQEDYQIYPDDEPVPYTFVTYYIYLRRVPTYFVFYLIMPCTLISATTLLSFFLPPESGEKVSLGITVLLSLTVFLLLVAELLPPTGAVPIIAIYYASTMVMVSLSLTMSVVVLNLHHRGPESQPVPGWLRRLFLGRVAKLVLMRTVSHKKQHNSVCNNIGHFESSPMSRYGNHHTLHQTVRYAKRRRKRPEKIEMIDICENDSLHSDLGLDMGNSELLLPRMDMANEHRESIDETSPGSNKLKMREVDILRKLLEEFRSFKMIIIDKTKNEQFHGEWKQVALVVDRIFMLFYFLGTLLTLLLVIKQVDFNEESN